MADRSRRERTSKLDKLSEYKRARAGGARVLKEEDDTIYDEVSEEQYRSIVKGRLQRDDFVIDDGADGYVDDGREDWLQQADEEPSEDEGRKKGQKKKKDASKMKTKPKPPPAPVPTMSAYRPAVSATQEAEFMSSLLGDFDQKVTEPGPSRASRKRKPSPVDDADLDPHPTKKEYGSYRRRASSPIDLSSDPPMEDFGVEPSSDDAFSSPFKRPRVDESAVTPTAEKLATIDLVQSDASFDDIDMDDFNNIDDDDMDFKLPPKPQPKVKKEEPKEPILSRQTMTKERKEELDSKAAAWLSVLDKLEVEQETNLGSLTTNGKAMNQQDYEVLEPDGSLHFFWLDYLEQDGKLHFTGKLKEKKTGQWISCCVTVENMQRNIFVLPRDRCVDQTEDGDIVELDTVPTHESLVDDFDNIRKHCQIKKWEARFVKRKYAFGDPDVPREEREWMKVVYGFDQKPIPSGACSGSIAKIFGTNTSAFELLVLKRRIMGPCWIQIKKPEMESKGITWCKVEATVTDPKDFRPFAETDKTAPREVPPLNVVSISLRTIVNHQANKREVVCASARVWQNYNIEDNALEKLKASVHTYVRPLERFPDGFDKAAKQHNIHQMPTERALLNGFLAMLFKVDPDVIIGHEFLGVSLDVLLNRMKDLKTDHWSRLSRFRRTRWPNIGRQGTNLRFLNGRLLCDLATDGARSMITSTTWSLTEMCKTHLGLDRPDYDPDDTATTMDAAVSSAEDVVRFVRHCEVDAYFQMAIASKVQILPLTHQLTGLAGNSWNKTLNGGRAERNEYILLHEFHKLKYICPDKSYGPKATKDTAEDEAEGGTKTKGKRDKYKGGLVFDPKRGLWDKIILVMDFNSLYPSIIQEYNIDFTTVEKVDPDENGEERIPEPPPPELEKGVLPRLISTLVNRRRIVKSYMKDKNATPAQKAQWDIKQQALKLTANSMYGCLGFEFSRFYARPLAALTTFKGREILSHTRELAESMNLEVVYGDTDSVFVNSNVTDFAEALQIAHKFKKLVNDQYKLLEIDLDSVFKRLLLLQKKKYAALKSITAEESKMEVKGLDMKRREYCALSKMVSNYVLEQILSGEARDVVVESIHEYLVSIAEQIREGKIPLEDFIINKRLGKEPEAYPDAKSQPHVQVALRIKQRGGSAKVGDVLSYIFCLPPNGVSESQAQCAFHPDEIRKGGLQVDYTYYLSHQILPPLERLCEPIDGMEKSRLAECLGLDTTKYRTATVAVEEGDRYNFSALDSQIPDSERFKDASPFLVRCRHCQTQLPFLPANGVDPSSPARDEPQQHQQILTPSGAACPVCNKAISVGSLQTQLEVQIRAHIARYYEGRTVCDDAVCGNVTRMMNVYGRTCLKPGCGGQVRFVYTDTQLFNQLRYFAFLFDVDKARANAVGTEAVARAGATGIRNRQLLQELTGTVNKYLNKCGRRWVDLSNIFAQLSVTVPQR